MSGLSILTMFGCVTFSGVVVWLHVKRPDVSPSGCGLSHYAIGSTRGLTSLAFALLAVALASAGMEIGGGLTNGRIARLLLFVGAAGAAVVGAVPVPAVAARGWRGSAHTTSALVLFLASTAGALTLSMPRGGTLAAIAWIQAMALLLFFGGMGGAPGLAHIRGWLQRSVFAGLVVWLLAAGWQFR